MSLLPRSHVLWTSRDEAEDFASMDLLHDSGFLILTTHLQEFSSNYLLIAKRCTESNYMYLFRKISCVPSKFTYLSIDMPNFRWVEALKDKMKSIVDDTRVHIFSVSTYSGIIGFVKCLLKEPGCQNIRCVYIQGSIMLNADNLLINSDILKKDLIFNVNKNDVWGSYVNMNVYNLETPQSSEHAYANIETIGDLTSLYWVESSCKLYQRPNYNIHYSSLNFRDIMNATGMLPRTVIAKHSECILGAEFSGTYQNKRVCGLSRGKCISSALDHEPIMVWDVPAQWTLAEAATVPVVYATVLYSLFMRGRLVKGETVLIHSGSGAVGLAAITIALDLNCTVFTTVGSNKKRQFLMEKFPELHEERILDSNVGTYFKEEILKQTKGRGVDLVLNSLANEKLKASLQCFGKNGRFLEIGKVDSIQDTAVGLAILLKSVIIHGIHLDDVLTSDSDERIHLQTFVQNYMDQGKIKPLHYTSFGHEQLEDAFRYLCSRKHVGKVIIKIRETYDTAKIAAIPRTYFYPHKIYIIIGGLGGMGLEMVTWMIERGARKLFIVSRSGACTSYQKYIVKTWEDLGANVCLRHTDVSLRSEVSKLMMEVISVGPLGGVFNLALVLEDTPFINQSAKSFETVSRCKAAASLHFDALSRLYSPSMDYFVVFSSISSGKGNAGQSNYGYANSVMEQICEQRKLDGLPGLAVQWGPVADVGSVGKIFRGNTTLLNVVGQSISSCNATLDLLLQQSESVVSSFVIPQGPGSVPVGSKIPLWQTVAYILGFQDFEKIDMKATMTEHGMDSIIAVQVKHAIQRKHKMPTPVLGDLTFQDLLEME